MAWIDAICSKSNPMSVIPKTIELVTMENVPIKLMIELNGDIDFALRGMGRLYRYSILYFARAMNMIFEISEKMKMIGAENPSIDRYPYSETINPKYRK